MLNEIEIEQKEVEKAVKNADLYLKHYGKKKKFNWFDMSHLLAYIFPQYNKEELFEIHKKQFMEAKQ